MYVNKRKKERRGGPIDQWFARARKQRVKIKKVCKNQNSSLLSVQCSTRKTMASKRGGENCGRHLAPFIFFFWYTVRRVAPRGSAGNPPLMQCTIALCVGLHGFIFQPSNKKNLSNWLTTTAPRWRYVLVVGEKNQTKTKWNAQHVNK